MHGCQLGPTLGQIGIRWRKIVGLFKVIYQYSFTGKWYLKSLIFVLISEYICTNVFPNMRRLMWCVVRERGGLCEWKVDDYWRIGHDILFTNTDFVGKKREMCCVNELNTLEYFVLQVQVIERLERRAWCYNYKQMWRAMKT